MPRPFSAGAAWRQLAGRNADTPRPLPAGAADLL